VTSMRLKLHQITALLACAALLTAAVFAGPAVHARATGANSAGSEAVDVEAALAKTVGVFRDFLGGGQVGSIYDSEVLAADDSTAQWLAFDFMRLGVDTDASGFLDKLKAFVTERYADPPTLLDPSFSSEWNRLSIIIKALGGDPTNFGTKPEGGAIDLVADGSYNWIQQNDIGVQGVNGWVYAIHALDTTGVAVPEGSRYTEDQMIKELLTYQGESGAFALQGEGEDLDITAMAIGALARHADHEEVYTAVSRALSFLSKAQGPDGRFVLSHGSSAEAQAQVIMALCSAGIDPRTNPDFVKGEGNALSGLMLFQREDGSFKHTDESSGDSMEPLATEQAMRALIAVYEFDNGGDGNVYTTDVALSLPGVSAVAPPPSVGQIAFWIVVGIVAALVVVGALYVWHRRKKQKQHAV